MADWVCVMVSPSARFFSSPPASRPTYCSPSRPDVRIFAEFHVGLEQLVVEADLPDAPDDHAGALDRRLGLEPADVVELGVDHVAVVEGQAQQVAGFQRQEQQRCCAQQHEQAYPDVVFGSLHLLFS
jgi:hypothetical protein